MFRNFTVKARRLPASMGQPDRVVRLAGSAGR